MAEFTAKDVQALRQATGAGMMDAKKALAGERRRLRGRRQVAAREGPRQGGRAQRPREHRGRRRHRARSGNVAALVELKCETDFVAKSDRLHRRRPGARRRRRRRRRGRRRRAQGPRRRPQGHAQGEHRGRPGRPHRGRRGQRPRHLPAPPGGPGQGRRRRRARRRHARSWPTTSPSTSPSPSPTYLVRDEVPGRRGRRRARDARRPSPADEGKPEAALDEDRRGHASAAGSRSGCCSSRSSSATRSRRSPSSSAAPRVVRFGLIVDRRLRRPHGRRCRLAPGPAQASGEAFAGGAGLRHRRPDRRADRLGDRRGPHRPRRRDRRRRRRRQHLAGHHRRQRRHGPRPGRLHGHAGHGHQRPRPPGHPRAARPAHPGAVGHRDGRRSPSPTSGAGPSGTSRRAGS